uniref:Uncharacterized protein n=1 Tax=Nymphaea colorata TaxID=210225 RepID=A0A5K1FC84_9MAGN|nr:unnamed protein product [Nymphaea colorata]
MGRHANDSAVLHSTIALLQERFRQLQRVKEMREEKELMRLVAETESRATPPPYCSTSAAAAAAAFCHPDAAALLNYRAAASPPPDQCGAQSKHLGFLQPAGTSGGLNRVHRAGEELRFLSCTPHGEDDSSEVDTSLHL